MMRINAILPEDIVAQLDTIASDNNKSRSRVIREAAEIFIKAYQSQLEEKRKKECIRQSIVRQDSLRKKSGTWDGIRELRKWRESAQ
ncbi:MAG: ribbon-helix-helix protein, CopG family [Candidatus Xenobiia bacterium LiM19]